MIVPLINLVKILAEPCMTMKWTRMNLVSFSCKNQSRSINKNLTISWIVSCLS